MTGMIIYPGNPLDDHLQLAGFLAALAEEGAEDLG